MNWEVETMMWGIGWGMPWFGWMLMVLVWVLVVTGVVWLVRALAGSRDTGVGGARRILDERFAAGEISADEYEARRAALR